MVGASRASDRALVLCNPVAGRGVAQSRLRASCAQLGVRCLAPESADELQALAHDAARSGAERVIVAGGDGSVHRAAAALAGTDCALGIVPAGTGNDLARALGLSRDPRAALARALSGSLRRIDLGRVSGRWFAGVGAAGIDAEVLRRVRRRPQRTAGPWVYAWAVLGALARYVPPRVRVEADGAAEPVFAGRLTLFAAANSPVFGGGMRVAPEALLDDGWLDLVLVRDLPRLRLLTLFPRIYRGTHVLHPAVLCRRVRDVTLHGDESLLVHGDGEPVAEVRPGAPLRIECRPGALRVAA